MNIKQDAQLIHNHQAVLFTHPHTSQEYKDANQRQRDIFQRYDEADKIDELIAEVEKVGSARSVV